MFAIGDAEWPGISKLAEENGEVLQIIGKLMGARGATTHWDGQNLRDRLLEEMADLAAAIKFVMGHNYNAEERAAGMARAQYKLQLFEKWHAENPALPEGQSL